MSGRTSPTSARRNRSRSPQRAKSKSSPRRSKSPPKRPVIILGGIPLRKTLTRQASTGKEALARAIKAEREAASTNLATREYLLSGAVENWYNSLRDLTFRTQFTMISREEAAVMIRCNQNNKGGSGAPAVVPAALGDLVRRVDDIVAAFPSGVSVKLSTRSPKDSEAVMARAAAAYHARLVDGNIPGAPETLDQLNARVIAFTEERTRAAIASSGREALSMLLDSNRVLEDLLYAYQSEFQVTPLAIVAREWHSGIRPACEFRGFTWGGRLTCIGQYFYQMYFPELEAQRHVIARDLSAFVEVVMSRPHVVPNAMLDLLWFGPGQCMLIEINPLDEASGSTLPGSTGLFNWNDTRDNALMHGELPFELRLRSAPPTLRELRDSVGPNFQRLLGL
jgi:hypothetical protein